MKDTNEGFSVCSIKIQEQENFSWCFLPNFTNSWFDISFHMAIRKQLYKSENVDKVEIGNMIDDPYLRAYDK